MFVVKIAVVALYISSAIGFLICLGRIPFLRLQKNRIIFFLYLNGAYLQLYCALYFDQSLLQYPYLLYTQMPSFFFIVPSMHFYILFLSDENFVMTKSHLLSFLPGLLVTVGLVPYLYISPTEKITYLHQLYRGGSVFTGKFSLYLLIVGLSAITVFLFHIYQFYKILYNLMRLTNPSLYRWCKPLVIAGFISILPACYGLLTNQSFWLLVAIVPVSAIISILYLLGQSHPALISSEMLHKEVLARAKYRKSKLEKLDLTALSVGLNKLVNQENIFKQEDLSLQKLAQALKISADQLSEYINRIHKTKFKDFINNARIEEAKKILLAEKNTSIVGIGFQVGFKSASNFHEVFKTKTGLSPGEYRRAG